MGNLVTILTDAHHARRNDFNMLIQQFNKDVTSMERVLVTYGFINPDKLKEVDYHLPDPKELKTLDQLFEQQQYLSPHFYNLVYGTSQIKSMEITFDTYDAFSDYATFSVAFVSQLSKIIEEKDNQLYNRVNGTLRVIKRGARVITESLAYRSADDIKTNIAQSYMELRKAALREREELADFNQKVQSELMPKRSSLRAKIERKTELSDELEREHWEVGPAFKDEHKGSVERFTSELMGLLEVKKPTPFERFTYESYVCDLSLDERMTNLLVHKRLGLLSDIEKAKKEYAQNVEVLYKRLSKYTPMLEWVKKEYVNAINRILQYEPFWNKVKRFVAIKFMDQRPMLYGKNEKDETVEVPYLAHEERFTEFLKKVKNTPASDHVPIPEKELIVESYLRRSTDLIEKTAEYLHDVKYNGFYFPQREYKNLVSIQDRLSKARGKLRDDKQRYLSRVTPTDIE